MQRLNFKFWGRDRGKKRVQKRVLQKVPKSKFGIYRESQRQKNNGIWNIVMQRVKRMILLELRIKLHRK